MSEIIRVEHLVKKFGDHEVLKDVHFSVNEGEVVSIIGASGSGKSTLLRTINLFEEPTAGKVYFKGEDLTRPDVNVNMLRTKIGMVFQSFNLFEIYFYLHLRK